MVVEFHGFAVWVNVIGNELCMYKFFVDFIGSLVQLK